VLAESGRRDYPVTQVNGQGAKQLCHCCSNLKTSAIKNKGSTRCQHPQGETVMHLLVLGQNSSLGLWLHSAMCAALLQDGLPHTAPPPHLPRWKKAMSDSYNTAVVSI